MLAPLPTAADALTLLRELREPVPSGAPDAGIPVLVLGSGDELAELRALRAGADDWLAMPVRYPVLLARLQALIRRARRSGPTALRIGGLALDVANHTVRVSGTRVELSRMEFALLRHLAADPTRVYTKDELLRDVWGFRAQGRTRTLDSHACRLRHKLAAAGGTYIHNVWGVGYRLLAVVDDPERNESAA